MKIVGVARFKPLHQQYYQFALGNRVSDDIVGAVGGCFMAEHRERLFSHRHILLTSAYDATLLQRELNSYGFGLDYEGHEAAFYNRIVRC